MFSVSLLLEVSQARVLPVHSAKDPTLEQGGRGKRGRNHKPAAGVSLGVLPPLWHVYARSLLSVYVFTCVHVSVQ